MSEKDEPLFVFGLDFTSAPTCRKPITVAICLLNGCCLQVESCVSLTTFADFEGLLARPGPWFGACDFPFGQPLKLLQNLNWPLRWSEYVQHISTLGRQGFEESLKGYIAGRMPGDKLHSREVDRLARAVSPMQLYRVPVGKMFYEGATRLLASDASILPCRPTDSSKQVLEGYPALVARYLIGKRSYKQDQRSKQSMEHMVARQEIVNGLASYSFKERYGVVLEISSQLQKELVAEPMGDRLDAVLCAVQAGWAYGRREQNYGIPTGRQLEGWIVDPSVCLVKD